ncbi:MAG: serine/threonine protein kinase/tetratricopeptide (TPR) repeat protein [Myxococcota bacterium]|jgi:serine/threonine protein kinase/tetratricopeptide (TPR) repeat protein
MGVVYRAVHEQTGEAVALKTVRVPDERHLIGLRREIRALSRVDHPDIVRVLDQGLHEGLPWYAMELIHGVSLRQRAADLSASTSHRSDFASLAALDTEDAATVVLDLEDDPTEEFPRDMSFAPPPRERPPAAGGALPAVLNLAYRLCQPLAFLHGAGIVHRDLKPENVLVRHDGRPVLMDFGLTTRFAALGGREQLAEDARLHGTVSYMSPEQIRGDLVDARADLYAFGVILYELVAGRLPFRSRSVGSVLYQHLESSPIPLTDLVTDVPHRLDELVLGLLAKRPEARVGYAEDVADVLARLGGRPAETAPAPKPRPYLYRPRFTGRDEALAVARQWLDRGGSPAKGLGVITGPSGIGRTRFAMRLSQMATTSGWAVLTGACMPVESATVVSAGPLHPLAGPLQTIADRCRHLGPDATDQILGERGPVLGEYVPELLTLPGQTSLLRASPLPPADARRRLLTSLTDTLLAFADDQPLLLLLDDLQWADPLTLAWLASMRRADRSGLLVVGTVRSELSRGMALLDGAHRIDLEPLDEAAVGQVIADMLALPSAPAGFVHFLSKRSHGVPFVVAEFLRAAISEQVLTRGPGGWGFAALPGGSDTSPAAAELPLPVSVRRMIEARLGDLTGPARALLELAAVLGRVVPWQVLELACTRSDPDLSGLAVLDAVQLLMTRQVFDPTAPEGEVRFEHGRIRDVVYDGIPDKRRAELHGVAALVLEARNDAGAMFDRLGHHWERAGDLDRARARFLAGARHAASRHAYGNAARLLASALRLDPPGSPDGPAIRLELAEALRFQGDLSGAMAALSTALETARGGAPLIEARALMQLAELTAQVGRLEDAVALYDEAGAAWPQDVDATELHVSHAEALLALGRLDVIMRLLDRPLPADPSLAARLLACRGRVALERKEYDAATGALEQALALSTGSADRIDVTQDLARLHLERGDTELAITLLAPIQHDDGADDLRRARALANLAIAEHRTGAHASSRDQLAQALHTFREHGHHRYQGRALNHLARFHALEGDTAAAQALARQSLMLLDAVGDRLAAKEVLLLLARLDPTHSRHAERARALAIQQGDLVSADEADTLIAESQPRP